MPKTLPATLRLYPIKSAPTGTPILLYWDEWGHFEDGVMYDDGANPENPIYHVLFDGDSMQFEPSHWAEMPEKVFEDD